MDILKLSNTVELLRFKPMNNAFIGFNMLLIKHEKECILIDTGYEAHFKVIQSYIESKNLTIKHLIISHFHNDHIGGIPELSGVPVHGSIFAKDTLKKNPKKDHQPYFSIIKKKGSNCN